MLLTSRSLAFFHEYSPPDRFSQFPSEDYRLTYGSSPFSSSSDANFGWQISPKISGYSFSPSSKDDE
jgi:hypothetical protein